MNTKRRICVLVLLTTSIVAGQTTEPVKPSVGSTSVPNSENEGKRIQETIERRFKVLPEYPEYLHGTSSGIRGAISDATIQMTGKHRLEDYDKWYTIALDYRSLAEIQLIRARRAVNAGNIETAKRCIDESDRDIKIFNSANLAAISTYQANIEQAAYYTKAVYETSRAVFVFTSSFAGLGPVATVASDYLYTATDFAVNTSEGGITYATKQAIVDIVAQQVGKQILLSGDEAIKVDYKTDLATILRKSAKDPSFRQSIKKSIVEGTQQYVTETYIAEILSKTADEMQEKSASAPQKVELAPMSQSGKDESWVIELSVPHVKQDTQAGCARACALMTIKYYCPDSTISSESAKSEIPDYAHISERVVPGISGLSKGQVNGTWFKKSDVEWLDFVKANIQKRYPLIVIIPDAQNLPWWRWNYSGGHYIVIRGIGSDESIICNDPVDGSRHIASKDEFQKAWGGNHPDAKPWQGIVAIGTPGIISPDLPKPAIAGMFITALVMDKSGSMTGDKIKKAKDAAYGYVDASGDKDVVSLIGFSSSAQSVLEPSLMSQAKGQLKQDILSVSAGGNTNIGSGLTIAHKHLSSCDSKGKMALLMTDGQHNTGTYEPEVETFVQSGWPIYTVAFGKDADQNTLRKIAEKTSGCFFPADTFNLTSVYNRINVQTHNGSIFRSYNDYIKPGKILSYIIPVDTDSKKIGFFTNWQGSRMETAITSPSGQIINKNSYSQLGKYSEEPSYTFYEIENPQAGNWQVRISPFDVPSNGEQINFHSFSYSDISSNILAFQPAYSNNQQVQIAVKVTEKAGERQAPLQGMRITADIKKPSSKLTNIIRGQVSGGVSSLKQLRAEDIMSIYNEITSLKRQVQLYDDGQHGDVNPGDGIYANSYADTPSNGPYIVTVFLNGNTSSGKHIDRILQETFQVGPIENNTFTVSEFLDIIAHPPQAIDTIKQKVNENKGEATKQVINLLDQFLKKGK